MLPPISKIKGVHPGAILERELKIRNLKKSEFATLIGEFPQTLNFILKQKRSLQPKISLKMDRLLGAEDGYFYSLQAYYDIRQVQLEEIEKQPKPNTEIILPPLFWDTDFKKIDFISNYRAVIERVFERGNKAQIEEIIRFYGKDRVIEVIQSAHTLLYTAIYNAEKYLSINKNSIECYKNSIPTLRPQPYFTSSKS